MAEFDDDSVVRLAKTNHRVEKWARDQGQEPATTAYSYGATVLVRITGGMDDAMRAYPGVIVERLQSTSSTSTSSTRAPTLPPGKVDCATFPPYGLHEAVWVYVEPADAGGVAINSSIVVARVIGVEPDGKLVLFHSAKCAAKAVGPASGCTGSGLYTWDATARTWALTSTTCAAPCSAPPPQFCPPASETGCVVYRSPCQAVSVGPVTCNGTTTTVCPTTSTAGVGSTAAPGVPDPCVKCAGYDYVPGVGFVLVSCKCPLRCPCWQGSTSPTQEAPLYTHLPSVADAQMCRGGGGGCNGQYCGDGGGSGSGGSGGCSAECVFYHDGVSWKPVPGKTGCALLADGERPQPPYIKCVCPPPTPVLASDAALALACGNLTTTQCGTGDPCAPMKTTTTPAPTSCKGVCFYRWDAAVMPAGAYVYAGTTCVGCSCVPPKPTGAETTCSYVTVPCGPVPSTTTTTTTTTTTRPVEFYCVSPPGSTYKFCVQSPTPAGYAINGGPYLTVAACNSNCSGPATTTTTKAPCPACTLGAHYPDANYNVNRWLAVNGTWQINFIGCGRLGDPPPAASAADWQAAYGPDCEYCVECALDVYYYCKRDAQGVYSCRLPSEAASGTTVSGPYKNDSTCAGGCTAPAVGCWQEAVSGSQSCFAANPGTGYSLVTGPYATMADCVAAGCGATPSSSSTTAP